MLTISEAFCEWERHRSIMIMMIPRREKMALTTFMLMLAFT